MVKMKRQSEKAKYVRKFWIVLVPATTAKIMLITDIQGNIHQLKKKTNLSAVQ
jgi:hypothetical protein